MAQNGVLKWILYSEFFYHAVGRICSRKFLYPIQTRSKLGRGKYTGWWAVFFAWIVAPWVVSYLAVPDLGVLLTSIPLKNMIWPYIFGVLWGIGGLTFGLTMRYLGMSLGMAMALGLTATFGTLVPPIYFGHFNMARHSCIRFGYVIRCCCLSGGNQYYR